MCGGESEWISETGDRIKCEHCDEGWISSDRVSLKYVGQELLSDIQIVSASEHHLPVLGGLLDQSAWWFELRALLRSEESKIQDDQLKRNE